MSHGEINWPSNPKLGDKIPAFKGGAWVWDGCAWTHTCCVTPSCDIRENGLNVGVTILSPPDGYYLDLPATQVYCLEYQGNDVWTLPLQFEGEGINLTVRFEYGQWVFVSEGTDFSTVLATLSGSEPVGIWEANNTPDSPAEIVSECGCVSTICFSGKKSIYDFRYEIFATMFPFIEYVPGSLSGNVLGYSLPLSTKSGIFIFNGEWYLIYKGEELLAVLPGVYPGPPVGTGWVPISVSSGYIIETIEGSCPCEPIVNGITLAMELDAEGGPVTIYVNFNPSTETLYTAIGFPEINLSYSGGVWSFNVPGDLGDVSVATLSGESPLGTGWVLTGYAPENLTPILSITTTCGTGPDNYGCLGYLTNGSPQSIVEIPFSRVVTGSGIFYVALGYNTQIVPTGPNTWEIQGDSGTIATATGPTNVPPFGLTWTILDPGIDQLGFDSNCPKFEIPK